MGWSFGNVMSMSLLSDPGVLTDELYRNIEPYLMDVILYDPPYIALGYPEPSYEGTYNPFTDPQFSNPDEIFANFFQWVSSYYNHPNLHFGITGLDFRKQTDRMTVEGWSPQDMERYFEGDPAARSELPMYAGSMQAKIAQQRDNACFDSILAESFFPRVRILHLACKAAIWYTVWAYLEHKHQYEETMSQGKKPRQHKFSLIKGANHFLHFDAPDQFLDEVLKIVGHD